MCPPTGCARVAESLPPIAVSAGEQLSRIVRSGRMVSMASGRYPARAGPLFQPPAAAQRVLIGPIDGLHVPNAANCRKAGERSHASSVIGRCTK
jgi:hypothetical protein